MQRTEPQTFINFRLPLPLFARLDQAARELGLSRAELLRRQIATMDATAHLPDQERAA